MKKFSFRFSRKITAAVFLLLLGIFSLFCLKTRPFSSWDTRFEAFTRQLFCQELSSNTLNLHYTLAYPEKYNIENYSISLGSMKPQNLQENFDSIKALKKQLERFPASKLSTENQMVYDILRLQFATELSSENCYLLQEPLSPNLGIQAQLPALLAEYTFRTPADVKDYLSLLTSLPDYFKEIQQFEQEKSRQGLFMSDDSAERTVQQCKEFCEDLNSHYLSETFKDRAQKLTELKVISKKQRDSYIKTHEKILKNCVFPAYKSLAQSLEKLKGSGKNQGGLCHLPEGKKYYAYLIKSSTGDYRSVREIQKHLYQQLFLDFEEIQNLVQKDPDIFTKAAQLPQTASSSPEQMLDYLSRVMTDDFPKLTVKDYEVKYVPDSMEEFSSPAFYLTPPVDTLTPNTIYINQSTTVSDVQRFTTLAHEGYPGHMYQTLYFNRSNDYNIRKLLSFSSYSEGWATYVEYYAYTLDNGLDPELGELLRHNAAFTLALYAILDVNIHYEGWDLKQVEDYLNLYFRISDTSVISTIYYDIAENPANYLEYYVGYLEIINLQREAKKTLGSRYTDMEFNRFLLDIGPAPFSVIKPYFNEWLVRQNQQ